MYFGLQKEGMEQKFKQYLQQLMKMFLEMECLTKAGPHSVQIMPTPWLELAIIQLLDPKRRIKTLSQVDTCHLAYIAVSHTDDSFSHAIGFNIENLCIDLFYWFDKSSKRKKKSQEHFQFCDQTYLSVLKQISVRWLSLEKCVARVCKNLLA